MREVNIEKLMARIPKKYRDRIDELTHDEEGYWLWLKDGWVLDDGSHLIHAETIADLLFELRCSDEEVFEEETYEEVPEEEQRFEMVVVWSTGEKEVHGYRTEEDAGKALDGMYKAFGSKQLWGCVRRKAVI